MEYTKCFKDQVVLVTGSGEGLGQSLCLKLAEYQAIVICSDKNLQSAERTVKLINSQIPNNDAQAIELDVTDVEQVVSVISSLNISFGKIDYLFNNAGIAIGGEIRDLNVNHWKKVIDVNLTGLMACSSEAFRFMSKMKQGHIINITSISGLFKYTPLSTPYAVSKHGAVTFSKALQLEAQDFNVKVTTVCPGAIKTGIGKNMEFVNSNEKMRQQSIEFIEKGISPELASQEILKGVVRNKKEIVFPKGFRNYYYLTKIFRSLEKKMCLKMIRDFRENIRLN